MTPAQYIGESRKLTARANTPTAYLQEAVKAFGSVTRRQEPLWRKRLPAWVTRFDRAIVVELMPTLVMRVRDLKSGQTLAESGPGNFEVLGAAHFQNTSEVKP